MAPFTTISTTISTQELPIARSKILNNAFDKTLHFCKKQAQKEYKQITGTFKAKLKWFNIIAITITHLIMLWGLIAFPYIKHWKLILYGIFLGGLNGLGVTAGAHRLWCHRSYKATLPLRIFLMLCFSLAGQNTLYDWVRDHRVHHKFTETDADPHNAKRGFFFAHVGWLMMNKHPEVLRRGKEIDMSDILADPVVQFHQKHFIILKLMMCFVIPTIIPPMCWNQDWFWSILLVCVGRYSLGLNFTWSVNSAAHMWGNKPYNKDIKPSENVFVSFIAMGEGWHNYHHTFPWDYRTAELGRFLNLTTFWINVFATLGLAYDLKSPSLELVKKVIQKSGDGSHPVWGNEISEDGEIKLLDSRDSNNNTVKNG